MSLTCQSKCNSIALVLKKEHLKCAWLTENWLIWVDNDLHVAAQSLTEEITEEGSGDFYKLKSGVLHSRFDADGDPESDFSAAY